MIVFTQNEQVYGFINKDDGTIPDEVLRNKIILCSLATLCTIPAVIRQAADNFKAERSTEQILFLMDTLENKNNNNR